jgi:DoxX-like family
MIHLLLFTNLNKVFMKTEKVIYWISTGLLCALMLFSASMYFTKTEMIKGFFESLHYPTYLVYPLATAKILGIIALISNKSKMLKEWAYAGFFLDTVLAAAAHFNAGDGGHVMALGGVVLVVVSRFMSGRVELG